MKWDATDLMCMSGKMRRDEIPLRVNPTTEHAYVCIDVSEMSGYDSVENAILNVTHELHPAGCSRRDEKRDTG